MTISPQTRQQPERKRRTRRVPWQRYTDKARLLIVNPEARALVAEARGRLGLESGEKDTKMPPPQGEIRAEAERLAHHFHFPFEHVFVAWIKLGRAPKTNELKRILEEPRETTYGLEALVGTVRVEFHLSKPSTADEAPRQLHEIKLVVNAWTTLDDIKEAWPTVRLYRDKLPGRGQSVRNRAPHAIDRVKFLGEAVQDLSLSDAVTAWNKENGHDPYDPDEAWLRSMLKRRGVWQRS